MLRRGTKEKDAAPAEWLEVELCGRPGQEKGPWQERGEWGEGKMYVWEVSTILL